MISVNIHQAKSNLSKLLSKVEQQNETIRLCQSGKPVAEIVPSKTNQKPINPSPRIIW